MIRADEKQLTRIRPLFDGFPGLHGMLDSVLEGVLGEAFVDDPKVPRVARLALDDFHCVAGDPGRRGAADMLESVPAGDHLAIPENWKPRLLQTRAAEPYDRFAFSAPANWDRGRIAELKRSLAQGFELVRVGAGTVEAFEGLAGSLVRNFGSPAAFLERGAGFAILASDGAIVAGCSSYAISSHSLEFEIQTRRDHQRRGLALVTGAAMVEYCLDAGLEPCWDAAHAGSALLAERLGFVGRRRYTAYKV
jgi:hypothetical protein